MSKWSLAHMREKHPGRRTVSSEVLSQKQIDLVKNNVTSTARVEWIKGTVVENTAQ